MEKKRNDSIDILKGIGIILVVMGHVINSRASIKGININNLIYLFHMPLFFLISGYLIKYEKEASLKEYAKKKAKGILLPYFIFSILCYIYWVLIERKIRHQMSVSTMKVFLNIFLGFINEKYLLPNIVLWFLPCLFISEILYFIIRKNKDTFKRGIIVLILFIIGIVLCKNKIILPFGIETALIALLFLYIGDIFGKKENVILKYKIPLLIFSLIFYIVAFIYNGNVSMLGHKYLNPILFVLGAMSGIGIIYFLAQWFNRIKPLKYTLMYYGKNSLIIMLCHDPIKRIVSKGISILINVDDEIIRNGLLGSISITIIILLIMIPIIFILNNYFPYLIGKNKINKQQK